MHHSKKLLSASALAAILSIGVLAPVGVIHAAGSKVIEEGKALAFDRKKGNCLACHLIAGGVSPGNIGPPLVAMKARFPDKAKIRSQIWDATALNPESSMPPFGKHGALSADEIDKIVEFIHTL